MATLRGTFVADFSQWNDAVSAAAKDLKTFEYSTNRLAGSLQSMVRQFDGTKMQAEAVKTAVAIEKIEGASKLTAAEQRRVLAQLTEVEAKYTALGKTAPAAVRALKTQLEALTAEAQRSAKVKVFRGDELMAEARQVAAAVTQIGGAAKLTAAEQRQVNTVVTEAIAKYRALGLEVPADLQKIAKETTQVAKTTSGAFGQIASVFKSTFGQVLGAFSAQAVFSDLISSIQAAAKEAVTFGSRINDLAAKTGISVSALQEFSYAAEQTGGDLESLTTATFKLQQNLGKGGKEVTNALTGLGLSLDQLRGLSPEQQFRTVATALGEVTNQSHFAQAGIALFGKGFQAIAPTIREGFQRLADEARRLGLVLSDDLIRKMDDLGDADHRLQLQIRARAAEHAESIYRVKNAYDKFKVGVIEALSWVASKWQAATDAVERQQTLLMQRTLRSQIAGLENGGQAGSPAVQARIEALRAQLRELERIEKQIGAAVRRVDMELPLEPGQRRDVKLPSVGAGAGNLPDLSQYQQLVATLREKLGGQEVVQQAKAWMAAVKAIGGITKLTSDEQQDYNRVLDEALRKYRALGQVAPAAWQAAYDATRQNTQALQQWAGQQKVGAYLKTNPFEGMFTQENLQTWVDSQVAQPIEIAIPLKTNPFEGMDLNWKPPKSNAFGNFFKAMFAGQNIGAQLTQTVIGAFQGGGSVGKSLGGALGGLFGNTAGDAIGAAVKGLGGLGPKLMGALGGALGPVGAMLGGLVGNLFGKLFGSEAKETKKMRTAWLEQAGGLEKVKEMAEYAGVSIDKLLSTKKTKTFEAEVKKLEAAFKATQERVQALVTDLQTFAAKGKLITQDLVSRITKDLSKPEVQQAFQGFVQSNMDTAAKGLATFLAAAKDLPLTQRAASALGDALGGLFARMQQLGTSPLEALKTLQPAIDALVGRLNAAGLGGGEAFDQLRQYASLAADEVSGPLLEGVDGLTQALVGLANSGLLTSSMFAGMAEQVGASYDRIVAGGADSEAALRAIAPSLQRLWEIQQQWGYEVDATTQGLLTEAEAQGLVGAQMQEVNKQILDVLKEIAKALGATIPGAAKEAGAAFERHLGQLDVPTIKVPYKFVQEGAGIDANGRAVEVEGFATGSQGLRNFGSGTLAMLHGQEAVLTRAQYEAIRSGGQTTTTVEVPVVLDGYEIARVVASKIPQVLKQRGVA